MKDVCFATETFAMLFLQDSYIFSTLFVENWDLYIGAQYFSLLVMISDNESFYSCNCDYSTSINRFKTKHAEATSVTSDMTCNMGWNIIHYSC